MLVMERATRELLRQELLKLVPGLELVAARRLGAGADAEEAVQEVLARALAAFDRGMPASPDMLPAFVHGIARHVIIDEHRRRTRWRTDAVALDALPAPEVSPLQGLTDAATQAAMGRAMRQLSRRDRELLRRCFVDGERLATIARTLGEPASRLRKRKSRALARLRALLGDADGTAGHIPDPTATT